MISLFNGFFLLQMFSFVEKLKQESLAAGVTGQRKSRSEKTGTYRSVRRRAASHPSRSKLERYISYNF